MANVDTISDISNGEDGQGNNLVLLLAMAALASIHSSPSLFFLIYALSEFADHDMYVNNTIPSWQ